MWPRNDNTLSLIGILNWFRKAKPSPQPADLRVQLGVHFEEVAEMLDTLGANDEFTLARLSWAQAAMHKLAEHLKTTPSVVVGVLDRQDFLDALCDQIVTATGCAHMQKLDIDGAINEVNESNWSKFVGGKPIFDENQKISKGPDYFKPDLTPFI